jgi:ribonuclease D
MDKAPFRIMPETLLLRLAEEMPENLESLSRVRGMTPYLLRKFGHAILASMSHGRETEPPIEPVRGGRSSSHRERRLFEDLRQWRKMQAAREGVEPVVILESESLRKLARAAEEQDPLAFLSDLKRQRYGEALKNLLRPKT